MICFRNDISLNVKCDIQNQFDQKSHLPPASLTYPFPPASSPVPLHSPAHDPTSSGTQFHWHNPGPPNEYTKLDWVLDNLPHGCMPHFLDARRQYASSSLSYIVFRPSFVPVCSHKSRRWLTREWWGRRWWRGSYGWSRIRRGSLMSWVRSRMPKCKGRILLCHSYVNKKLPPAYPNDMTVWESYKSSVKIFSMTSILSPTRSTLSPSQLERKPHKTTN